MNPQPIDLPYRVVVTQDFIDSGDPGDCDSCPVALSLYSQLIEGSPGRNIFVEVQRDKIDLNGWLYETPQDASEFIMMFDMEERADVRHRDTPFEFTITHRYDTIKEVAP